MNPTLSQLLYGGSARAMMDGKSVCISKNNLKSSTIHIVCHNSVLLLFSNITEQQNALMWNYVV